MRLQDNPGHYRIEGDTKGHNLDERLEKICSTAIAQLVKHKLIDEGKRSLKLTPYGEAMARYYVNLTTMANVVEIPQKPKLSELVCLIFKQSREQDSTDVVSALYADTVSRIPRDTHPLW